MFQLEKHQAKIASATPIAEKHGEETVLAAAIKFDVTCSRTVLDQLGLKKLREALFRKPGAGQQQELEGMGDGHTALAFPQLGSLRISEEFTGYTAQVGRGLDIAEPLSLTEATVKKLTLDPVEGGSVKVSFSLVCHPDPRTLGELCEQLQDPVDLTLSPPAAAQQKAA